MTMHCSSKLNSKIIFYSYLTLKFFFSISFFLYPILVTHFLILNSHLSPISIKLSPLPPIHHPLTAATKAHHRTTTTEGHHRRFIILLPFLFFLSSSTSYQPNSPTPHRRPTLTHLALAANPSPKPQVPS